MDFAEMVSPTVTVPVLCVLVCAFLVFIFGFKSPAQPPSFDVFEEDSKRKRSKKSKGTKGSSNGHAVVSREGDSVNVNNNAKVQLSQTQPTARQIKAQQTSEKTKLVNQTADQPKKVKKPVGQEESKIAKPVENTFDEGWHTISKKEKKTKKKDGEKAEPVVEPIVKHETEVVEAFVKTTESNTQASPQEQRNKKKKEKKVKKTKIDGEAEETEKTTKEPTVPIEVQTTELTSVKSEPEVVKAEELSTVELQIQDAMEEPDKNTSSSKKKSRNKKKSMPVDDDFVIPEAAVAQPDIREVVEAKEVDSFSPMVTNTEALTVKTSGKQRKGKHKQSNIVSEGTDDGTSVNKESSSLSQSPASSQIPQKEELNKEKHSIEKEPVKGANQDGEGSVTVPPVTSFDEMEAVSESWTEAKPKIKKKKTRRAD